MKNLLFYLYVPIEDLEAFEREQLRLCRKLKILGRVLFSEEGVNGNLTGTDEACEEYIAHMKADPRFQEMDFKIGITDSHNFKKLIVKKKKEIVTSSLDVDLKNKAPYIQPEQLKKELDEKEDLVLIDVRNDYESKIGHFEGSVFPNTDTFRDFKQWAQDHKKDLADKNIVTYCTGGIRCEKATAYLKEIGYNNVRQLHNGIIKYGETVGDAHWNGKCFVFDTRGAINIDPKKQSEPITQCEQCHIPDDTYYNCANLDCDKRVILCEKCVQLLEGCCSKKCRNHVRTHPQKQNKETIEQVHALA